MTIVELLLSAVTLSGLGVSGLVWKARVKSNSVTEEDQLESVDVETQLSDPMDPDGSGPIPLLEKVLWNKSIHSEFFELVIVDDTWGLLSLDNREFYKLRTGDKVVSCQTGPHIDGTSLYVKLPNVTEGVLCKTVTEEN